jgi:hypothetical protein
LPATYLDSVFSTALRELTPVFDRTLYIGSGSPGSLPLIAIAFLATLLPFTAASEHARADVDQKGKHRGVEKVGKNAMQGADATHRLGRERNVRSLP